VVNSLPKIRDTKNPWYFTKSTIFYPHWVNYHAFFRKNRMILHQIPHFPCTFGKLSVPLQRKIQNQLPME